MLVLCEICLRHHIKNIYSFLYFQSYCNTPISQPTSVSDSGTFSSQKIHWWTFSVTFTLINNKKKLTAFFIALFVLSLRWKLRAGSVSASLPELSAPSSLFRSSGVSTSSMLLPFVVGWTLSFPATMLFASSHTPIAATTSVANVDFSMPPLERWIPSAIFCYQPVIFVMVPITAEMVIMKEITQTAKAASAMLCVLPIMTFPFSLVLLFTTLLSHHFSFSFFNHTLDLSRS